jgi:hypothetical protein
MIYLTTTDGAKAGRIWMDKLFIRLPDFIFVKVPGDR